ncbi:MAG: hypothetical protein DRP56_08605, partial [Planctomycetota bacterium]
VFGARVEQITLNAAAKPNTAIIRFPTLRWQEAFTGSGHGFNIRIRTDQQVRGNGDAYRNAARSVLFQGFLTNYKTRFAGATGASKPTETNAVIVKDARWLMSATSVVYGVYARSRDDYSSFTAEAQTPANTASFFSGRRCIFNQNGKPNRDSTAVTHNADGVETNTYIFASGNYGDPQPWTARQMLQYLLCPYLNKIHRLLPIRPASISGIEHTDFDRVINHIAVDTMDVMAAVNIVLKNIGWSLREQYTTDGVEWVFYKPAEAATLHTLHAPAAGEVITDAVAAGAKLLYAGDFDEDIAAVINTPVGLGAPERFEFTAELVPAWLDTDLTVPAGTIVNPFFVTEAELQADSAPNDYDYYKYYHTGGSGFKRNVGRKWALNEAVDYAAAAGGDRGMPFEFADILARDDAYSSDTNRRRYGLFRRVLLECLTFDKSDLNSVGIKVEFSFDGGTSWHTPQLAASVLTSECGIYIDDPNLSELLDPATGTISGGDLDGKELNYWTSLCDDKAKSYSFKDGDWNTRVRVTASVQLDQRLIAESVPTHASGSPFYHRTIYDFSDKYTYSKRTDSSIFADSGLSAWDTNEYEKLTDHLDALRDANEDASINGRFTLDRLWLGDGAGQEDFRIGDGVEGITGRNYSMTTSLNGATVCPEIIQITYDIQRQKQHLITRDLRLAEMRG